MISGRILANQLVQLSCRNLEACNAFFVGANQRVVIRKLLLHGYLFVPAFSIDEGVVSRSPASQEKIILPGYGSPQLERLFNLRSPTEIPDAHSVDVPAATICPPILKE